MSNTLHKTKRACLLAFSVGVTMALWGEQADYWSLSIDDGLAVAANATGQISDGEWTLRVRFLGDGSTSDKRTLKLGVEADAYGSAFPGYLEETPYPRTDGHPGPLNLDKPVHLDGQEDWRIVELESRCFAVANSTERGNRHQWLTSLRLPKTLVRWGLESVKCSSDNGSVLTEVIADVPDVEGDLPNYGLFGQRGLTRVVLKAPKATGIGKCFLYSNVDAGLSDTDASDWSLPSVTKIGGRALARLSGVRGKLRLPKAYSMTLDNNTGVFQGSGFEEIELGTEAVREINTDTKAFSGCTILRKVVIGGDVDVTIGTNAFQNCSGLVSVRIGTERSPNVRLRKQAFNVCVNLEEVILGGSQELYLEQVPFLFSKLASTEADAVATKLSRLRFLGVAPTLDPEIANATAVWGNYSNFGHIPAKQLTVEIPGTSESWKEFLKTTQVGAPSDGEKEAYHVAWKSRAIPYGVLPVGFKLPTNTGSSGSPLGFKNAQYLAVGDRLAIPGVCQADGRYGDRVDVSYASEGYENDSDGTIPYGAPCDQVMLTASTTCPNGAFVRWYYGGAINEANQRTNPIVLSFDELKKGVYGVAFQHDWVFDAESGTISDGVWKLKAHQTEANQLAIGNKDIVDPSVSRGHAYTGVGEGKLDLSGVVRGADGTVWTITSIDSYSLGNGTSGESIRTSYVTEIVFPECLMKLNPQILNNGVGTPILTTVVLEAPALTSLGTWTFAFQAVRRMVLRTPKVSEIPEAFLGSNHGASVLTVEAGMQNPLDLTDVSEWDLSGVTTCDGRRTFALNCLMKGTLRLPSCVRVKSKESRAHGFLENAQAIDGVELATAVETLDIAEGAFKNSQMKKLMIGARKTLTVGTGAFSGCSALTNLTCYGEAPAQSVVDELLAGVTVPTDGTKNCTLYVSGSLGWQKYAVSRRLEETSPAGKGFMGVYATLSGDRKAWMFYEKGPWEPRGMVVVFR